MARMRRMFGAVAVAAALLVAMAPAVHADDGGREDQRQVGRTPIVLFPAFHLTKLLVTVTGQTTDPACPSSGSFQDFFLNDQPSAFSPVCQDELLTLNYAAGSHRPMPARFSEQAGVNVSLLDYGKTMSAPFYETLYTTLEAAGYTRDRDIRIAGYDARLTPDMGGFLARTKRLIERTSKANGNRPVHLVGHSNGPLYAQYLLTHTTQRWKDRYIHGFTPFAGNFPGQGVLYPVVFTGLNNVDFTFPATPDKSLSAARMFLTAPSTYMSASDPKVFGDREVVVTDRSTGKSYTPIDWPRLFADAGLPVAAEIAAYYIGFVRFTDPASFPNVDVYAEKGSGIPTVVGASLRDLSVGQPVDASTELFTRDGDINQEDITNDAVGVWAAMDCFHFSLTDNPGVDHFALPSNPAVLARLVVDAARPRSRCDRHDEERGAD
jgi:lecithin-cholesterol acyltransferase